jgi:hypothetical protein
MIQARSVPLVIATLTLVLSGGCTPATTDSENDKAIIAVALQDFANWKDVTFGNLEGVLELDPVSDTSLASRDAIRSWSAHISNQVGDDLIDALIRRNKTPVSIGPLISDSRWARLRDWKKEDAYVRNLPKDAKAVGSLTLPGISADGLRALVLIHHSWSIHGAVVTYVLSKQSGAWIVTAKDQAIFL